MTLSNNPNPADDKNHSPDPHQEFGNLFFPQFPRANHNRILVDAYLRNCERGFIERNTLITNPKEMEYEDRASFDFMANSYRGLVRHKLRVFGLEKLENDFTLRFLHPVVAVGKTRREHHLYVDAIANSGGCSFVDSDAMSVFKKGPAAVQLSRLAGDIKQSSISISRLFSVPGFHEAMSKLAATSHEELFSKPRSFVAFGWIVRAIAFARAEEGSPGRDDGRKPVSLNLSEIENFTWTGCRKPYTFECSIGNSYYAVQIMLHPRSRQPITYVHEETF